VRGVCPSEHEIMCALPTRKSRDPVDGFTTNAFVSGHRYLAGVEELSGTLPTTTPTRLADEHRKG